MIRSKEQLVALRAQDGVLHMETMLFGDEVIAPESLDEIPDAAELEASEREVAMAGELIESLAADFDPSKYRDSYRDQVLDLVERKAEGDGGAKAKAAPAKKKPAAKAKAPAKKRAPAKKKPAAKK